MQNVHAMRPEVRTDYERALAHVSGDDVFATRFERFFTELRDPLVALYGDDPRFEGQWLALLEAIARTAAGREGTLRTLDHEREITPDWLQREQAVGYVTYVDRFAGTLTGVRERLPYLRELGISYLHLMSLLHARPQPNDGGYAVVDYGAVEPALGSMDDLRALADELRAAGMALCIDVVLNHTAREHPWAQAARDGDARALAFYRTFADRAEAGAYELTLPEVFPATAPGNFTWEPALERWVWTTFNAYQWDLDYSNPEVFRAMAEAMLELAAAGADVLRLDAVPFLWKRKGTNSQNQPEVHQLLQAFRAAMRIAAPAVAFKAEAIVSPRELVGYLGAGRHQGKECHLAYHNVLMVLGWSALASGRAALLTNALRSMPAVPPGAGWVTYVRCHDDIGWAITDEDAGAVGEDAHLHRRFLADFYAGDFPASFARGARFHSSRKPARRVRAGPRPRWPGSRPRSKAATSSRSSSPCVASCCSTRSRSPTAACRSSTWATSLACSTTTPGKVIRRAGRTTAGCTARRWTGRRPSGAASPARSRGACGTGCAGWWRRGAPRAPPTCRARPSRCGRETTTSSACCAVRPASACSCWPTSRPSAKRSAWAS